MTAKKSILFVGEAVSLAHVTRPLVLAQSLDPGEFEIHFACDPRYYSLLNVPEHIRYWPISSVPGEAFVQAVEYGWFDWEKKDVERYAEEELRLYKEIAPSLVVGDYRFTLPITAEFSGITSAVLANIHWSPYCVGDWGELPKFPPRPLAMRIKQKILNLAKPAAERSSTAVFNALRRRYGLAPLSDFHELAILGNYTLYVEPPGFIETKTLPENHMFLGPINWSPNVAKPAWWQTWDPKKPIIYVTLGSSGAARQLPEILDALTGLGATVVVATANRAMLEARDNVFVAGYLPGSELCKLAAVVICNGGSATAYQALGQGAPVVGIWSNVDQYYTMTAIERFGAGLGCRASTLDPGNLLQVVSRILKDDRYRARAANLAEMFGSCDARKRFVEFVRGVLAQSP